MTNQAGVTLDVLNGSAIIGSLGPFASERYVVPQRGGVSVRRARDKFPQETGQIKYEIRYECAR